MKKILLTIWRILPFWSQRLAARLVRPYFQVAVGAIILNASGQMLLCKHTYRRIYPWGLPGGDLKHHEDPVDGIRREVLEETGFTVDQVELLLAENSQEIHHVCLTYLCSGISGSFTPNEEVSAIQYFDTDQLPDFFAEQRSTIDKYLLIMKDRRLQVPENK
jgi:8-oxo-dGTP diphosphatase